MVAPVRIPALKPDEQNLLDQLIAQLNAKMPRNTLRSQYYDSKNIFKNLGISTPPNMQRIETVLGWPAKAVDLLNRRCNLDGFALPGGDADAWGVRELWDDNHMDREAPQAGVSSLIHSEPLSVAI